MFVVLLKFAENRSRAGEFMDGHKSWIQRGVFLVVGSLQPNLGGAVLAHGVTREDLQARVDQDPFVIEGIVSAEIIEIAPGQTDPRLEFLKA